MSLMMLATDRKTRALCLLLCVLLTLTNGLQLSFPQYSYMQHPMYYFPQFSANPPHPVIMKKYTLFSGKGEMSTRSSVFAPYQASYRKFGSDEPFMDGLDALYITRAKSKDSTEKYAEIELNDNARVFLLIGTHWLNRRNVGSVKSIEGLDQRWRGLLPLLSVSKRPIPVGRQHYTRFLPAKAVALERTFEKGEKIILPHPQTLSINGRTVKDYHLVFAQLDQDSGQKPRAFVYPASPSSVVQLDTGLTIDTRLERALPNTKCPSWLHDLYRTTSRDISTGTSHGELMHWRTWHAPIDPVYWCYFNHEHGSYPGEYKPIFDYTAFKTYDNSTDHNRQEESDEGFKVYSIPLHSQQKYLIMTVHIQASKPRRFFTRHHTGIFAVLNSNWEIEMELHMKMDFGASLATLANRKNIPMNDAESETQREMRRRPYSAFRRFNVLNLDKTVTFPKSLNMSLGYRMGLRPNETNKKTIMKGMYENWRGVPNTCAFCMERRNCGLTIDIRNVATAKRTIHGGKHETMQWLSGDSLSRVVKLNQDMELGIEHCHFNIFHSSGLPDLSNDGVFYTDAYFSEVHMGAGSNSVRQFIKSGFEANVIVKKGMLTMAHPWSGPFEFAKSDAERKRRILNTERAILREMN